MLSVNWEGITFQEKMGYFFFFHIYFFKFLWNIPFNFLMEWHHLSYLESHLSISSAGKFPKWTLRVQGRFDLSWWVMQICNLEKSIFFLLSSLFITKLASTLNTIGLDLPMKFRKALVKKGLHCILFYQNIWIIPISI